MKGYGDNFAEFYRMELSDYPLTAAPWIMDYFFRHRAKGGKQRLLDLCCGTGQLAWYFLNRGFNVTGIDASPFMLKEAVRLCNGFINDGKARFIEGDASDFSIEGLFDLITATSDSINHLGGPAVFRRSLLSVGRAAEKGSLFVFDMITQKGLRRWDRNFIDDKPLMIMTGAFDEEKMEARRRMIAYLKTDAGSSFERYETELHYYVLEVKAVEEILHSAGFDRPAFFDIGPLRREIKDPENRRRIFAASRKM